MPDLFKEFGLPYLKRISEEFEGLYYHSCGNYLHCLDIILLIPKLKGINGHTSPNEMDPIKATNRIYYKCVYFSEYSPLNVGWDEIDIEGESLYIYY